MNFWIYLLIGSYTTGGMRGEGLYVYRFDAESGKSEYVSTCPAVDPSYMSVEEVGEHTYIYAVSEGSGEEARLNVYELDKGRGTLRYVEGRGTGGDGPCHVNIGGGMAVTSNYGGGSISVFKMSKEGRLEGEAEVIEFEGWGPVAGRQESSHLHCTSFSADGRWLYACDLGSDKVYRLEVKGDGSGVEWNGMKSYGVSVGSGPRQLAFHPSGSYMYVLNELSGTVDVYGYSAGKLKSIGGVECDSLHAGGSGGMAISPDGRYLYATNRLKGDGVVSFRVEGGGRELVRVGYKATSGHPRDLTITANGRYMVVACRDGDRVEVMEINEADGQLRAVGEGIEVGSPVCVKFIKR
jgi:6-phosphogluconolactonase (cycloisomerase 2 family)